ncbi:MAG: hypothetical protein Q7S33_04980 [Nanoarchaeota archaeon]|nr:hypothetical protein [Nanoarchaeota archaeon]
MKKWLKIFLIILAILVVGIGIFAYITYNQIQGVLEVVNDNSLQNDLNSLRSGDCSKLPVVEQEYTLMKEKISAGCSNPALKPIIEKEAEKMNQTNICEQIKNPDNQLDKALTQIKTECSLKSTA